MSQDSMNSMEDFGALLDAQMDAFHGGFDPGTKVTGTILEIGPDYAVLDISAKQSGIIPRQELVDKEGELTAAPGEDIEAYFVAMKDGAFLLSTSIAGAAASQQLRAAYEQQMPVAGLVKAEINGGYEITVSGERAFCPYSQIDLQRREPEVFLGKQFEFMVSEFDPQEHNIVLSRRMLLERQREAERETLMETLAEGDNRQGRVTRIADFGVFVDLGGVDGLIPAHELAWDRDVKPEDVVTIDEEVTVRVQKIDWDQNRISLSLRYAQGDPWEGIALRFPVGVMVRGTITRLETYGAFAQLEPGVEGLIHISKLGNGRRLQHAREEVSEGQEVDVEVEAVDEEARRISLRAVNTEFRALTSGNTIEPGAQVSGIVQDHKAFGVFVQLGEDVTGLLHISETRLSTGGNTVARLAHEYPVGSEITTVIKAVDGPRISLTLPDVWEEQQEEASTDVTAFLGRGENSKGLGSLGDAFDGLKL